MLDLTNPSDLTLLESSKDLETLESALERQALEDGKERYLKSQERLESDQGYGSRDDISKIIKGCLPTLTQAIESYQKMGSSKGKGKTSTAFSILKDLDPSLLASVTLSHVFSLVHSSTPLTTMLASIGQAIESELWAKALEEHDSGLCQRLVKKATRSHGSVKHRKKAVKATAAKAGFKIERWDSGRRVKVAEPLVNCLLKSLPEVFELYRVRPHKDGMMVLVGLTPQAAAYISEITEAESWMHPVYKPMVVPPRPWTSFDTGAYHSPSLAAMVPLMRTHDRERRKLINKAIRSGVMAPCLEALNIIQDTAWAINKPVLEIAKWCWDQGMVIDTFPQRKHLPRPERPTDYDTLEEGAQKAWRIKAAQTAERNRSIDAETVTAVQDFIVADQLTHVEQFWIPHTLDFRGRVYPVPHFNQQRADHIKGLMRFAIGKPLGDNGVYWLMVHLANCGDFEKVSKASFDDRVQWVLHNEPMVLRIARDPKATFDIWSKADKPFQFLAACFEWAAYMEAFHQGEEYNFISHLPIALDGSNSGLQHYAASLRSLEGSYVNLTPSEKPRDIYQAVADIVLEATQADAATGDPVASLVLGEGITRKLVKRNVMTFAYSSVQFGFKQQLLTDLMGPLNLKVLEGSIPSNPYDIDGDRGFKAAGYIASKVWKAVNTLVQQAGEGMRFYQRCATALAHEAKGLTWFTPVGLPVLHKYVEFEVKRVQMFLYDKKVSLVDAGVDDKTDGDDVLKKVRLNVRTAPTKRINKDKARNAIAPNVIHSMDAAHLMLTVLEGSDAGIKSFSLIHDSFGTHAADTDAFFQIIREAFVGMYENFCPFDELRDATHEQLDDKTKVPEVPTKGTLDLQGVLDSDYAFA